MRKVFSGLNLTADRLLEGYYSLFCLLFAIFATLYIVSVWYFWHWLMFLSGTFVNLLLVVLSFRSLMWFVLNLLTSPIFMLVILERYDISDSFEIFLMILWLIYWILLSFVVNIDISRLGNEIVSKILRIVALIGVVGIYYVSIENDMDLQAVLRDTTALRIALIVVNIYMLPSLITLLMFDLGGHWTQSKTEKRLKFSFAKLKYEILNLWRS